MQRAHHGMGQRPRQDVPIQVYADEDDSKSEKKYKERKRLRNIKMFFGVMLVVGFFAIAVYSFPRGNTATEEKSVNVVRDKVVFLPRDAEKKGLAVEEKIESAEDEEEQKKTEQQEKENVIKEHETNEVKEEEKEIPGLKVLAKSQQDFAVDLYQTLTQSKQYQEENIVFSPFSISVALAMTYLGAKSESATQMEKVLKFHQVGIENIHPTFHMLRSEIFNQDAGYVLNAANKLFIDSNYTFVSEFLSATEAYYDSALEPLNFGNPEESRVEINKWVDKQTQSLIQDLIPEGVISTMTKLVLVNAIYFKGKWANQFNPKFTKVDNFYLDKRNAVKIPMMYNNENKFKFYADDVLKCQILEMPYSGSNLSMIAILPDEVNGLLSLQKNITSDTLQKWFSQLHETKVDVTFPRFKMESSFQLKSELQKLGMVDIFVPDLADLTGMADNRELFVYDAVHKSFIEVTEEGTEAAAASAVLVGIESVRVHHKFNANHPFLFLIRDNTTGTVLFMGRIMKLSQK
uniref:Serpin B3-like n=1 Tax=Saccoglossus kowalevskii TaxID=10224 RepID=A0ABM0GPE0_SACKO|nr:PREDICTED: serpin B3-like [Saccoglossus kowalevskii]